MAGYYHQYDDLPQIPSFTNETSYPQWNDCYGHMNPHRHPEMRTNNYCGVFNDGYDHGMLCMQRFIDGPSPLTPGLLHAKLDRGMSLHSQNLRQCQQQWHMAEPLRNGSPDRTSSSGYSSHATQNELCSPKSNQHLPYGSPGKLLPPAIHYSSLDLKEGFYPSELPPSGGRAISLRQLEYQPQESEIVAEEQDHVDLKAESEYEADPVYTKAATTDSYHSCDSGIGNSLRDAESVEPITPPPDAEASDSDYKPSSNKAHKRRRSSTSTNSSSRNVQRRRGRAQKSSVSSPAASNKVSKRGRPTKAMQVTIKASGDGNDADAQHFPCPLAGYGCTSNFSSKNEWKRHVSTQHIKLGFWRCDLCNMGSDPNDDSVVYHNDFNRKDLFTQHLRRMHAAPPNFSRSQSHSPSNIITEDNIVAQQIRCYQTLRKAPQHSSCLFCDMEFNGPSSWDERMEHIGRHLEKDGKAGTISLNWQDWKKNESLELWLMDEGLINMGKDGWHLGDGKPKRVESEDDD